MPAHGQTKPAPAAPASGGVCAALMKTYNNTSMTLADNFASPVGDNSAPRATLRKTEAANAISIAKIALDLMRDNRCALPKAAPSASPYLSQALRARSVSQGLLFTIFRQERTVSKRPVRAEERTRNAPHFSRRGPPAIDPQDHHSLIVFSRAIAASVIRDLHATSRYRITLGFDGAGLVTGKVATVLIASGGVYGEDSPIRDRDIVTQYLRVILGVIGITDVTIVSGGGAKVVDMGGETMPDFIGGLEVEIVSAANA